MNMKVDYNYEISKLWLLTSVDYEYVGRLRLWKISRLWLWEFVVIMRVDYEYVGR